MGLHGYLVGCQYGAAKSLGSNHLSNSVLVAVSQPPTIVKGPTVVVGQPWTRVAVLCRRTLGGDRSTWHRHVQRSTSLGTHTTQHSKNYTEATDEHKEMAVFLSSRSGLGPAPQSAAQWG